MTSSPLLPSVTLEPIGIMHTCFKEKFGIPRQPLLVKEAKGVLKLRPEPFFREALRGIEGFSHLWVVFLFHHQNQNFQNHPRPTIRPPRLGGGQRMGVFASRSPHRPNPIGMSAVELEWVDFEADQGVELHFKGVDLLDGTPVLDLKPYLPYADAIHEAKAGWAEEPWQRLPVEFSAQALEDLRPLAAYPQLRELITGVLELDPRPAFQKRQNLPQEYGTRLLEFDIQWAYRNKAIRVLEIRSSRSSRSSKVRSGAEVLEDTIIAQE